MSAAKALQLKEEGNKYVPVSLSCLSQQPICHTVRKQYRTPPQL
jgi:hypothetical protein